jgi:nicotinate-nucleotide pyrophosphorylase (carboxylating)
MAVVIETFGSFAWELVASMFHGLTRLHPLILSTTWEYVAALWLLKIRALWHRTIIGTMAAARRSNRKGRQAIIQPTLPAWGTAETNACRPLVELALAEDCDARGDRTSLALIAEEAETTAAFVARRAGVVAGLPAVELVCLAVDPKLILLPRLQDGAPLRRGAIVATIQGPTRSLLKAERIALNFLQHLSGIATLTRRFVRRVWGTSARIYDTRKTLPGWRVLQKYAVRMGGGHNHRMNLSDGILIKDNHLAALQGGVSVAIDKARTYPGNSELPLEIEVTNWDQFKRAVAARPDIILLDNMPLQQIRRAVRYRNTHAPTVQLEASGGVTLASVGALARTGVDRISVGALTHSVTALDIALDINDSKLLTK